MLSEQTKAISSNAIKAGSWKYPRTPRDDKQTKRNRHRHTRLETWCAEIEIRESTQTADIHSQVARLVSRATWPSTTIFGCVVWVCSGIFLHKKQFNTVIFGKSLAGEFVFSLRSPLLPQSFFRSFYGIDGRPFIRCELQCSQIAVR